jgi:hypothetical protein
MSPFLSTFTDENIWYETFPIPVDFAHFSCDSPVDCRVLQFSEISFPSVGPSQEL